MSDKASSFSEDVFFKILSSHEITLTVSSRKWGEKSQIQANGKKNIFRNEKISKHIESVTKGTRNTSSRRAVDLGYILNVLFRRHTEQLVSAWTHLSLSNGR